MREAACGEDIACVGSSEERSSDAVSDVFERLRWWLGGNLLSLRGT